VSDAIHPAASGGYAVAVDAYERSRPGYPLEAVAWLARTLRIHSGSTVLELGAGTGKLTSQLVPLRARLVALEPVAEMRAKLAPSVPSAMPLAATAEALPLDDATIDAAVAAQAFHWFDHAAFRTECARILKPRGVVALFWNVRRVEDSPFAIDYEALLREFGTDYLAVRHENVSEGELAAFFGGRFVRYVCHNVQRLDRLRLRARLLSSSYVPATEHPWHEPMLAALEELFETHHVDGTVAMEYELRAYASRLDKA